MIEFKVGDKVKIVQVTGKDTPITWIGRVGILVGVPLLPIYCDSIDKVCSFRVRDEKGITGDFYLDELTWATPFKPTDYETI